MDTWTLPRKRRAEKSSQAEHKVHKQEGVGGYPEQHRAGAPLSQATEGHPERAAATPGEPGQPLEHSCTPRFHFPG